jgi:hypothetical protein
VVKISTKTSGTSQEDVSTLIFTAPRRILQIDNNANGIFYLPSMATLSIFILLIATMVTALCLTYIVYLFKLREGEGHAREVWELLLERIQHESFGPHEAETQICTGL